MNASGVDYEAEYGVKKKRWLTPSRKASGTGRSGDGDGASSQSEMEVLPARDTDINSRQRKLASRSVRSADDRRVAPQIGSSSQHVCCVQTTCSRGLRPEASPRPGNGAGTKLGPCVRRSHTSPGVRVHGTAPLGGAYCSYEKISVDTGAMLL